MKCFDCPRNCGVDREIQKGFCREGAKIRVAKVIENFEWEESCFCGNGGLLAIFFSGCNGRCKFCQNYEISHIGKGKEYTPEEFAEFLQSFDLTKFAGIDLITPTHFSSALCQAFSYFKSPIPVIWNSSGYEKVETIQRVAQFVDVFLVDFKFADRNLAQELASCPDYFDYASKAIIKMSDLKPNIFIGENLRQGVLIRHLILPGHVDDSKKILDFIKENIRNPLISIMSQFTPIPQSPIQEKLKPIEQKIVLSYAQKLGLNKGYFQDLQAASTDYIPKF